MFIKLAVIRSFFFILCFCLVSISHEKSNFVRTHKQSRVTYASMQDRGGFFIPVQLAKDLKKTDVDSLNATECEDMIKR